MFRNQGLAATRSEHFEDAKDPEENFSIQKENVYKQRASKSTIRFSKLYHSTLCYIVTI